MSLPAIEPFIETDKQPNGHFALSVQDLDAMYRHVQGLGLEVVSPPKPTRFGFESFFVRAPQKALLEFVRAGPIPPPH